MRYQPRPVVFVFAFIFLIATQQSAFSQKLTADEVVAKHLDSIAPAASRSEFKSLVAQGSVLGTIRIGGSGQSKGGSVIASQGNMSLMGFVFGPQEYSNEKIVFDGKKLLVGEFRPGVRTRLGGFLVTHDVMFKEGLFGGALSTTWPLLNLASRGSKVKSAGTKKIDGRQMYVLNYDAASGGNLEIKLFFDAETFQHVRTEYEREIMAGTVTRPEDAARQRNTRLKLVEDFSDFRKEGPFTLPHSYKLQLSIDTPGNSLLQDWVMTLSQFLFNKELDKSQFTISTN
jgi:hypothetical protein